MKRQLTTAVALTLVFLMSFGQVAVLAGTREKQRANADRNLPLKFAKIRQDAGTKPKRPAGESSTLLPDGRLLLIGGEGEKGSLTAAEIRDDRTGAVTRLAQGMGQGRAWHTATVLSDGKVVIIGGITAKGKLANTVEIFDPETSTFSHAAGKLSRSFHTATLLTDGRVFIAGGSDEKGQLLRTVEFWSQTKTASVSSANLQDARVRANASLQSDGSVLISAGSDESGAPISSTEIYDPANDSLTWIPAPPVDSGTTPRLVFSLPADGTVGVDPNLRIALRFSKPVQPDTINQTTVKLIGPKGDVPGRVVAAEGGRLAFVTPLAALEADSTYHLSIDGASDATTQKLDFTSITFKTKADKSCREARCGTGPQIIDADSWIPSAENFKSNWKSGRADNEADGLPALQAAAGETALAGKVRALSGNPLPNVMLQIGDHVAVTDSTGRFLLSNLTAGRYQLTIQGHTASKPGKRYGTFDVLVDITAGKTTVLSYTIWLPVLDEQSAVPLPVPTDREIGVTTPRVPGMEVRIPADAVLRMPAGAHHMHGMARQELTSLAITPIPVDRTPFPLPPGINDGLVFTLQLHGARVEGPRGEKRRGLRIVYPNYQNLPAGDRVEFWNYDPAGPGWYMYGHGTVTADRRQIIPDPGVELQNMYCLSVAHWASAPGTYPSGDGSSAGDPVDLGSGLFVYHKTDLVLPDVLPIELSRTYRQNDSMGRSFGVGAATPYDIFILGDNSTYNDLILADGGRIHFTRAGTDMVFVCNNSPTRFYHATLTLLGQTNYKWQMKLIDGTIYEFAILSIFGNWYSALSLIQDRFGNQLTIARDDHFRPKRITSPNGRWVELTYTGASPSILSATDNTGRVVTYTYDASGRLWKVTDAKGGITEYSYDASHRMLTIKDPRNIVYLTNEYDPSSGRITRQTQADTGVYQFAYTVDGQGKVTQTDVTDPRGFVRRTTFNTDGYSLTDTFALGQPEQQNYTYVRQSGTNLITSMTDALGRTTALTYDSQVNVISVTRLSGTPDAVTANMTYEPAFNQLASVTDPMNHTISFSYDANGMQTSVTDPLNHQATFTYNTAGQVLTATDALQHTTQFGYDAGDLVSITHPLNHTVTRYIDAAGRLTQITNPLGEVARFEFDSLNQSTRGTDPLQGATQFSYDGNGNLLNVTDPRNSVTTYIYDSMDRVATRRDPLLHDATYQYDLNGNLSQATDRKNQITNFTYDGLNRLTQVTYADTSTTSYTYDAGNRLTQVVDSLSGTITYGYDELDRLTSKATPQGNISYAYDAAGRRTSMTVAGQATVNYSYDNGSRLTQITQGSSTVTIAYDDIGRRTSLTLPNGIVTEYGYDAASQLTSLTYKQGGNVIGDLTYEHDTNGRRTRMGGSFARSITPQALASATYNVANQQLSFGNQVLTYDLNGNLSSDGVNSYIWDARNHLVSMSGPNINGSFQYDAFGRRLNRTTNGQSFGFLYSGSNMVQELSNFTPTANLLTGGVDEVFVRNDAAGAHHFISDALGPILSLTNGTGSVETDYSYDPFGKTAAEGTSSDNSAQFTARENDPIGIYYYRARYYSPSAQRFLAEDPLGFDGGDINIYSYVKNSPTNYTDPSGKDILTADQYDRAARGYHFSGRKDHPVRWFGDGGVLTQQTFSEFISANERARQPCKPFGERWLDSFTETNQAIPGFAAPFGMTFLTAPGAKQITGEPGLLGWAWRGGGPGFGAATVQSGLVSIATHTSFEGGIAVGSFADAIGAPCGY